MPSVDSSGQLESGYLQGERKAKLGSRMVTGGSHIVNQDQIEAGTWFTNYTKSVGPQLIVSNTTLAVELQTPHRLDQTINIFDQFVSLKSVNLS